MQRWGWLWFCGWALIALVGAGCSRALGLAEPVLSDAGQVEDAGAGPNNGPPVDSGINDVDLPPDVWVTNGPVHSAAAGNGVIYLGGSFTYVGPPTGSFVALNATSGAPDLGRVRVTGRVLAITPDGSGGWYIGGSITAVDGVARNQ